MRVPAHLTALSDGELAARLAEGDHDALAALFDRHVVALHDFVTRIVRDRDAAADAVQSTFVKAWDGLRARPGAVADVRAWLFVVARNAALDELRRRRRVVPDDQVSVDLTRVDPSRRSDPVRSAQEHELAELVWSAAAALSATDYALLDLHLRQGLSADELAETLGVRKGAVYTRLSRLRDAVEESITSTLMARHARRDCAALDATLGGLPAHAPAASVRRAVRSHLRECGACRDTRGRLVSPLALLGALAPVPLPLHRRDELWERVAAVSTASRGRPGRPGRRAPRRRPIRASSLVALVVLLVAAAGAVVWATGDGGPSGVVDPVDVHSTSHTVGLASGRRRVTVVWTPARLATGYSVRWSRLASDTPDTAVDLPGRSVTTTSPELAPGRWWFHLRTRGSAGTWTATVHVGPFVISGPDPTTGAATAPTAPPTSGAVGVTTSTTRGPSPPSTRAAGTTTTVRPPDTAPPDTAPAAQPPATQPPPDTTTTTDRQQPFPP